ncbi:MAG: hypothetical protein Q9217_005977, partial [Psora testacea]
MENISAQLCGTSAPPASLREMHVWLQKESRARTRRGLGISLKDLVFEKRAAPPPLVVETHFHIVTTLDQARYFSSTTRSALISNQAAVLNQAYRSANISFHVNSTTYTIKNDWATDQNSTSMKKALRRGGYSSLNIWFQSNLSSWDGNGGGGTLLLGYCTLPTKVTYVYD